MLRVCLQSASTYLQRSFLLVVTVASDLLVRKSLLNYVLLSHIVSGGVRRNPPPDKHPQVITPPCLLPFVGRLGSGPRLVSRIGPRVRVSVTFLQNTRRVLSYDVLRQQKTGVMTKGVVSGGSFTSFPAYNLDPVTNTSSSSCANNERRTPP